MFQQDVVVITESMLGARLAMWGQGTPCQGIGRSNADGRSAHRQEQLVGDAGVLLRGPGAQVRVSPQVPLRLRQRDVACLHVTMRSEY